MEFVGIESVVFGTPDIQAAGKFFADTADRHRDGSDPLDIRQPNRRAIS